MQPPLFICYHTPHYAAEAAELAVTLRRFALRHEIVAVPDLGSWAANTSHKPTFIRDMMLKHEGRRLIYLDSDARIREYPSLFWELPPVTDIAAHYLNGKELLSGTLYFGPTKGAWEIVREWESECRKHPAVWDQRVLQRVLAEHTGEWQVEELPPDYVQIFDTMAHYGKPVIEHMQASRRLKR